MWRCADCNKVFFSSNHGPNILDGQTLCHDCLRIRYNTGKSLIPPTGTTRVAGIGFQPSAVFFVSSGRANPNWAAVSISGAMFMGGKGGVVNIAAGEVNPPSNEMTMEQMLARVDLLLHLSPEERAAAKRIIRQMWGFVD
jgi:hypothetical protein